MDRTWKTCLCARCAFININPQELTSSREVDQKRKEDAMERLSEARLFVEVETEKRRKKREAQERADLEVR